MIWFPHWARSVLGWETSWELLVQLAWVQIYTWCCLERSRQGWIWPPIWWLYYSTICMSRVQCLQTEQPTPAGDKKCVFLSYGSVFPFDCTSNDGDLKNKCDRLILASIPERLTSKIGQLTCHVDLWPVLETIKDPYYSFDWWANLLLNISNLENIDFIWRTSWLTNEVCNYVSV